MSEAAWFLDEIDPETRQQAINGAASRGLSLEAYLSEVLALAPANAEARLVQDDDIASTAEDATSSLDAPGTRANVPPIAPNAEGFAMRHRLEALERRVSHAVSSLDSAINGLDSSVFGLASRLDEDEASSATAVAAAQQALQDLSGALAVVRKRLAESEARLGALGEAHDAARRGLDQRFDGAEERLDAIEHMARGAERAAASLAEAQETLRHAVAADLNAFAHETGARMDSGFGELRAAAEVAAENVDLALAHLVHEMSDLRQSLEDRLAESATETRTRVQAAFADAVKRMGALSERLGEQERATKRTAEQLRAQIAEVETGAHAALEQTAATLRLADTALAAELIRSNETARSRAEALDARVDTLESRQQSTATELQAVDSAMSNLVGEVIDLREASDRRAAQVDTALRQTQAGLEERLNALSTGLAANRAEATQLRSAIDAELERVEACAFAGLEKQARALAAFDTELDEKLARGALATDKLIEDVQARLESELVGLRDQQHGLQKRMAQVETTERPLDRAFAQRIAALENDTSAAPAIESLQRRLAELAARLDGADFDQIRSRVTVAATDADRAQQRVDRVELDLADLKLAQMSAREVENLLPELAQRIEELELRQNQALDELRDDISAFIDGNDRRLSALELGGGPERGEDLAASFEALRQRIEDRVLGVEQRSVRALAQVAETITAIEHRLARPVRGPLAG